MRTLKFLITVGCLVQLTALHAQNFSTEFSVEMTKTDDRTEIAPQLRGILDLPLGEVWAMEFELASSQSGLDIRVNARRDFGFNKGPDWTLSVIGGLSTGDAFHTRHGDLGLITSWRDLSWNTVFHYAPFSPQKEKCLEITAQYTFGTVYLQGGVYLQHAVGAVSYAASGAGKSAAGSNFSVAGVLTLGVSFDLP